MRHELCCDNASMFLSRFLAEPREAWPRTGLRRMPLTESSWRSTNNTPHHAARASRGAAAFVAVASAMVLVATGSALAGGAADEDLFRVACNHGGDEFGFAIATDGDFNGDGVNDIAVGSP